MIKKIKKIRFKSMPLSLSLYFYLTVFCLCVCVLHAYRINVVCHVSCHINRESYSMVGHVSEQKSISIIVCKMKDIYRCELRRNHFIFFQFGSIFTVSDRFSFLTPRNLYIYIYRPYYRESIDHFHVHSQPGQNDSETQQNHIKNVLARNINVPI